MPLVFFHASVLVGSYHLTFYSRNKFKGGKKLLKCKLEAYNFLRVATTQRVNDLIRKCVCVKKERKKGKQKTKNPEINFLFCTFVVVVVVDMTIRKGKK